MALAVVSIMSIFNIISAYLYKKEPTLTVGFTGDVMLGRGVHDLLMMLPPNTRSLYPWGDMLTRLQSNDINIINLETTLTNSTALRPKVFNFKADPSLVTALKTAHIGVATTANNHILDFDYEGLYETLKVLDGAGIAHVGSGLTLQEARKPVIITQKGITIGIIGATDNEPTWQAGADYPGINYVALDNLTPLIQDIATLRSQVDIIILSLHWGPNKIERPTQEFQDAAHALIDAGVDIIHGHSPHLVQAIEIYNKKLIIYGAGDFVDDYAVYEDARNDLSFLYNVSLDKKGPIKVQLIPTIIANGQVNSATGSDYEYLMTTMRTLSQELGTTLTPEGTISIKNS